jgi:hypothetical protein
VLKDFAGETSDEIWPQVSQFLDELMHVRREAKV